MCKKLVIVLLLTATSPVLAQIAPANSSKALSSKITHGLVDAKERLDAIFRWVTDNIAYDVELYEKYLSGRNMYEDFKLTYRDSVEYNEAVANLVLSRKKAVCDGYARLFKSLCNHARIQCEVVNGGVKSFLSGKLEPHAWNAVRLYGKWHLVDPTWASGHVGETFTKQLDTFYYLTPPEKMFINHLPDHQKWTLLDKSYDSVRFNQSPIEDIAVIKNGLTDFFPKTKMIKLRKGQHTTVWLQFDRSPKDLAIDISAVGEIDTRASRLNLEMTEEVYDSLFNIDPDYFKEIPKIEIVSQKIVQNKIEFVIKPLADINGIQIHVEYGFPALIYTTLNPEIVQ